METNPSPSDHPPLEEPKRARLGFIATVVFIGVIVAGEIYFRGIRSHRILPDYDIALHSQTGQPVGKARGKLKLRLDPFCVYTNLPDQETEKFIIDKNGFRGPSVDLSVRKSLRVAILGGSAAFGLMAGSDQETFAGLLSNAHSDWQVINAGVTGFLSGQELSHLVHHILDIEPDLVVIFDGWNDLFVPWFGNGRNPEQLGYNSNFNGIENQLQLNLLTQEKILPSLVRFLTTVVEKSALIEGLGMAMVRPQDPHAALRKPPEDGILRDDSYFQTILEAYLANLAKMADICRVRGIETIVAIQPEIGHRQTRGREEKRYLQGFPYYRDHFPPLYRKFARSVVASPLLKEVLVVDLSVDPRIRLGTGNLFTDYVHFTPKGNLAVAEALNERILEAISE